MLELLSIDRSNLSFSERVPLSAFRAGGKVKIWDYKQATRALREVARLAGMDSKRVSLHSLRIGFTTVWAWGGGISDRKVKRKGTWKSGIETYKVYRTPAIILRMRFW